MAGYNTLSRSLDEDVDTAIDSSETSTLNETTPLAKDTIINTINRKAMEQIRRELQPLKDKRSIIGYDYSGQVISNTWYIFILSTTTDVLMCLAPASFFTLAWCAFKLSGQEVSPWGTSIQQWVLVSPTILPILFAAVVTRSTSSIATYLLERGVKLMTLEQLLHSTSISSAFLTQIALRRLTPVGVALLILWSFSPIGGQASLRPLSTEIKDIADSSPVVCYMDPRNQTSSFGFEFSASPNPVYGSSLFSSPETKSSPRDNWGNVKIPYIDLSTDTDQADAEKWLLVRSDNVSYSSLLGYLVAGLPTKGSSIFTLESSYFRMRCQNLFSVLYDSDKFPSDIPNRYVKTIRERFSSTRRITVLYYCSST